MIRIYQIADRCIEDGLVELAFEIIHHRTYESEAEGVCSVREDEPRVVQGESEVPGGVDGEHAFLGHLEPRFVGVGDPNGEVLLRVADQFEHELGYDGAAGLDVVGVVSCVRKQQSNTGYGLVDSSDLVGCVGCETEHQ